MYFIAIFIAGSVLGGFFGFGAGVDTGHRRAYESCIEQQAQSKLLLDARAYCGYHTKPGVRR